MSVLRVSVKPEIEAGLEICPGLSNLTRLLDSLNGWVNQLKK